MNWVEAELAEVAKVDPDPDAWLRCYPSWLYGMETLVGECDHRFVKRADERPMHLRGWFRLPVRTFCRKCGCEA